MAGTMLKVDGKYVKDPSEMTWGLMDISSDDAGRTEDTLMHKNRLGQKRKLSLVWNLPTPDEAAEILTAFNPEYFDVTYHDAMSNSDETRTFYCGDREAPVKMWTVNKKRYTSITFNIIEQ